MQKKLYFCSDFLNYRAESIENTIRTCGTYVPRFGLCQGG